MKSIRGFMGVLQRLIMRFTRQSSEITGQQSSHGTTIDYVRINQDGNAHAFNIGHTAYGKGYEPGCGHKPQIIIENEVKNESD